MNKTKRCLSLFLALLMCLSLVSASWASGEAGETDREPVIGEISEEPVEAEESAEADEPVEAEKPIEADEGPAEEEVPIDEEEPAPAEDGVMASGKCGENLDWTLDDNGVLTISGTGDMYDYSEAAGLASWSEYRDEIRQIRILDGVERIGDGAFVGCRSVSSLTIPAGVASLGGRAIAFSGIGSIIFEGNAPAIDEQFFYNQWGGAGGTRSYAVMVYYPAGDSTWTGDILSGEMLRYGRCKAVPYQTGTDPFESIVSSGSCGFNAAYTLNGYGVLRLSGSGAVETDVVEPGVSALESYDVPVRYIEIENGITAIGDYAFYNMSSIETVSIPGSVKSIGASAFWHCAGLREVTIPQGVEVVGDATFIKSGVTKAVIPVSATEIGRYAFADCADLTQINVADANPSYTDIDGVLFDKGVSRLITFPAGKSGVYTVPAGVTVIEDSAFSESVATGVTLPDGVTSIESWAFNGASLESIYLPATLRNIGEGAFEGTPLTDVYFAGDQAQWDSIRINTNRNSELINAAIHYNSGEYAAADALPGDLDDSGTADSFDSALILRYMIGLLKDDDYDWSLADLNGDGVTNAADAALILA